MLHILVRAPKKNMRSEELKNSALWASFSGMSHHMDSCGPYEPVKGKSSSHRLAAIILRLPYGKEGLRQFAWMN